MSALKDVRHWRRRLGFLPVPLFGETDEDRFVLLNGSKGNFCLDVGSGSAPEPERQIAWSADVDHYISIGDKVHVYRWDQQDLESYAIADIEPQLDTFQRYLESRSSPRERSVVAHAMKTYRTLRARVATGSDGYTALLAYLRLLSKAAERQRPSAFMLTSQWSDANKAEDALVNSLRSSDTEELLDLLLGESLDGNRPDIELMIRHAAGRIFQEAHYLAFVDPQLDLFSAAQAKPTRHSSAHGAFFTPTPLVRTVVEQALAALPLRELSSLRIFDPACGSGEFLREAVRQLEIQNYTGVVTVIGFDVSPAACAMANFLLAAEQRRWSERLKYQIDQRDSLDGQPWAGNVDCCLMNPPFVSWRGMSDQQKAAVRSALNDLAAMRPDMASAFLALAQQSLAKRGVLGAVLPASLLDGDSAEKLRIFLEERLQHVMLARLGSQQIFADALVDPGLVVARSCQDKASSRRSPTVLIWADHAPQSSEHALRVLRKAERPMAIGPVETTKSYSVYVVADVKDSLRNWAPRPFEAVQLLQLLRDHPTVGDVFSVQQGTLTGLNVAFLLARKDYETLPRAEQQYFRPAIVNDSIQNGQIRSDAWVFYPYGQSALASEREVAARMPRYFERWLRPNKPPLLDRAGVQKNQWWSLTRPRTWQVPKRPKIVSTYFGASGSFAWDASGEYVVVQGYGWQPNTALDETDALALLAFLTSRLTDQLLSAVSNNLSGGQWNLSKRFIEKMPLPDLRRLPTEARDQLAAFGQSISSGAAIDGNALNALVENVIKRRPAL